MCPNCGEKIESNLLVCNFCGKSIESKNSSNELNYQHLSLVSLIIGCIAAGIFWWLPVAFLNFANEIFSRNVVTSLLSIYLLISLLGFVIGLVSIKKGKKVYSMLGFSFNIVTCAIIIIELIYYFTAFL